MKNRIIFLVLCKFTSSVGKYNPELKIYFPGIDTPTTRVLWLCVNSREVNFDEGFYPTDDVVYFICPKTVLEQLGELRYLILFTFMSMKI